MKTIKIESLFISDIHLGNPNSQADKLLEVFKKYDFNNLFIVGDFIDMTYMKRKNFFWRKNDFKVIQRVLKLSRKKVNVIYVVGNHDNYVRYLLDDGNIDFGGINICNEYIYKTLNDKRLFITHGDEFDGFIRIHPIIYWLGDNAYELTIKINKIYNWFRKLFGLDYWSLATYLKRSVKKGVSFLAQYEKLSEMKLIEKDCDAILMGHTHTPMIKDDKFYNTGDFVESCTYIIENLNGNLELKYVDDIN